MSDNFQSIESLYQKLLNQCIRANSKRNLTTIKEVCEEQVLRGSHDFTIATIAKISTQKRGPKESSIRNKGGEKYRALIEAYKKAYLKPTSVSKSKTEHTWVEDIEQPDIKWLVKDLLAENTRLKGELRTLKSVKTLNVDLSKSDTLVEENALSRTERNALADFVGDDRLIGNGWFFDNDGRLVEKSSKLSLSSIALKSALYKIIQ